MTRYTLTQLVNSIQDKSFSFYKVPKHIAAYFGMSTAYTLAGIVQHWQKCIERQGREIETMPIPNRKMREISGVSNGTLRKILQKLESLGILKITGDGIKTKRQITLNKNRLGDLYFQDGCFSEETIHQWSSLFYRKMKRTKKTDQLALNKENRTLRHINGELFDFYRVPVALVTELGVEVTHTLLVLCEHWGEGIQKEHMQVQIPVTKMEDSLCLEERDIRRHIHTLTGKRLVRVEYRGFPKTCFYEISIRNIRGILARYKAEFVLGDSPEILSDLELILGRKYINIRTKSFQGSKLSEMDNHAGLEDRDMREFGRKPRTETGNLGTEQNISDISSENTNILQDFFGDPVILDSHDSENVDYFANANGKETKRSPCKEKEKRKEREKEKSPYNPLKEKEKQRKERKRNHPLSKKEIETGVREEIQGNTVKSECHEDEHIIPSLDGYPIQELDPESKFPNEETLKTKKQDLTPTPPPAPSRPLTRSLGLMVAVADTSGAVFTVENFPAFYDRYPRKVHRTKALSAWLKLNKLHKALRPTLATVMTALDKYRAFCEAEKLDKVLIKHPSTFLNSGSWDGIDDDLEDLKLIMTSNKTKYRPIEPSNVSSIVLDERTLRNALYDYENTMDGDYQSLQGLKVEAVHALAVIFQEFQSRLKWRSQTQEPYCHRWINVPKSLGEFIRYFGAWLRMQTWIDVNMKTLSSIKIMERWASDLSKDCGYSIFTGD